MFLFEILAMTLEISSIYRLKRFEKSIACRPQARTGRRHAGRRPDLFFTRFLSYPPVPLRLRAAPTVRINVDSRVIFLLLSELIFNYWYRRPGRAKLPETSLSVEVNF